MLLKKIRVHNFKSIYEPLELDFDLIKGFWRINGPVGAGKTTIGEAIIYGLFGDIHGKNNRDLISWGENHCCIETWCICKGSQLYIKRDINQKSSSPIYVEVDNKELVFTNKRNAQQQLEEDYYDISRITLELLCVISFNNFKSLATLNTADTKQFLDQVFGFYILSNYVDACKNEKSLVRDAQNEKNMDIRSLSSQIDKINQLSAFKKIEGDIQDTSDKIDILNEAIRLLDNDRGVSSSEYNKKLIALTDQLSEIRILGTNKAKEIKFIEQGKCPTCGAPIDQSQLEIKKKEKDILTQRYTELSQQINAIKEEQTSKLKTIADSITEKRKDLMELTQLKTQLVEQEKRLKINTKEVKELEKQLKVKQVELDVLNKDEQEWNQLIDILSADVRHSILASFIPMLNASIREYTVQFKLPYIILFDESFKCSVSSFGSEQNIPISSLSTGQLKVVNISIILGILNVITNNSNFNVCLLDELLGNMDADLRQIICDVLKRNMKPNQTLFVISHTEFEDNIFDGVIDTKLHYNDNMYGQSTYNIKRIEAKS